MTGTNSRDEARAPGVVSGRGHVDHVFDRCPLNPGSYLVTAAVTDWSYAHRYDYWDHAFDYTSGPAPRATTPAWSSCPAPGPPRWDRR